MLSPSPSREHASSYRIAFTLFLVATSIMGTATALMGMTALLVTLTVKLQPLPTAIPFSLMIWGAALVGVAVTMLTLLVTLLMWSKSRTVTPR
jgi:hypothetical protein